MAEWLAALDGVTSEDLISGMNQKELRQWKTQNKGFRSFTVLRHPAERIHQVFCQRILQKGPGSYGAIRETLRRQFKVPLPKDGPDENYSRADHRAAFEGFLSFVKANLAGQTSIRVDAEWSSQSQALSGFAELGPPDLILREEELATELPALAQRFAASAPAYATSQPRSQPYTLGDIHDAALEEMITALYQRDYVMLGFDAWRPQR